MTKRKEESFYYILCGSKDFKKEYLEKMDLDLGNDSLMVIKCNSQLGKLINKKAKAQFKKQ